MRNRYLVNDHENVVVEVTTVKETESSFVVKYNGNKIAFENKELLDEDGNVFFCSENPSLALYNERKAAELSAARGAAIEKVVNTNFYKLTTEKLVILAAMV